MWSSVKLVRGHGPQHLNGTFGPGVPAEQISRFRKTVNLCFFWIFGILGIFGIFGILGIFGIFGNFGKIGIFDDFSGGGPLSETLRC